MIKTVILNSDNQVINTLTNECDNCAKAMILDSILDYDCEVLLHYEDSHNTEVYIIQSY